MKEILVKINKRFLDKKIIVLSELNIDKQTKYKQLKYLIDEINTLEPTQILIPGNLYNYKKEIDYDDKVNTFLKELSGIADTYYIKGKNDNYNIDIYDNDNLNILCEINNTSYNKKIHTNGLNIYGMRLGKSYYKSSHDDKLFSLIYKYNSYLDNLELKDNDVNILLCYDALIKELYDYSDNLNKFDMVITSNNYNEKNQLIQKGTTLFFLADAINKDNMLFSKYRFNKDNFDILNCEYNNTRSLIKKR